MTPHIVSSLRNIQSHLGTFPQNLKIAGLGMTGASFLFLTGTHIGMISSHGVALGSSITLKTVGFSALATILGTGGALAILYIALLCAIVVFSYLIYKEYRTMSNLSKMNPNLNYSIDYEFKNQQFTIGNNQKPFLGRDGIDQLKKTLGIEYAHLLPQVTHILATNGAIEAGERARGLLVARIAKQHGTTTDQVVLAPRPDQIKWTQNVEVDKATKSVRIRIDYASESSQMYLNNTFTDVQAKVDGTSTYTIDKDGGIKTNHNYELRAK